MLDRTTPDPLARARALTATVATRLREARIAAGLTLETMAARLGLTFQQVQKYERGTNRISAGRLALVAEITRRDIGWFFDAPADPVAADFVLRVDDLFVRDDSVTAYIDEAQRFTRDRAQAEARRNRALTVAPASDFAGDLWRSRASLIAELEARRAGAGAS